MACMQWNHGEFIHLYPSYNDLNQDEHNGEIHFCQPPPSFRVLDCRCPEKPQICFLFFVCNVVWRGIGSSFLPATVEQYSTEWLHGHLFIHSFSCRVMCDSLLALSTIKKKSYCECLHRTSMNVCPRGLWSHSLEILYKEWALAGPHFISTWSRQPFGEYVMVFRCGSEFVFY